MTQLTIDGETFRVEIEGGATKPALVLSHALGTDLSLWDAQMPALTRHFRVIRYDSRGHGGSAVGQGPYALERLGRDVIGILDALEIERAHVVGISMGGSVAQWLMLHAPDRIERAVLANTAAKIGTPEAWNGRIGAVMDDGMDAIAADMMERWFSADFAADAPDKVAAVDKVFRATSPEGYTASCAALRDMDLRHAVGGIRHPVLVVRGKDDPVASEDDAEHLVEAIAGAKLVALDARHISPVEAERAFADAVIKFLTAKAPARARPALPRAPRKAAGPVRRQAKRSLVSARSPVAKAGAAKPATKPAAKATRPAAKATKPAAKPKAATPGRRSAAAKSATRNVPARTSAATRAAAKKAAPTKARARTSAVKPATKTAARKATVKTTTRAGVAKARAAKPVAKRTTAKVAPARRAASSAASRATPARKKAPAKGAAKVATKAAVKKTAAKTPAAKRTAKLPAPRRKAAATPRRPAGRRKP